MSPGVAAGAGAAGVPGRPGSPPLVLVLCVGNSCRSQMAESFLREASAGAVEVASAGLEPAGEVHPLSVEVMREVGHDLAGCRPKHVDSFGGREVETVITVCAPGSRCCPSFGEGVRHYCWEFDDPATAAGTGDEVLACFRRVRDEIARVFTAYGRGRADGGA